MAKIKVPICFYCGCEVTSDFHTKGCLGWKETIQKIKEGGMVK